MNSNSFISFENVTINFNSKSRLFKNLCFEIQKNSLSLLIGPTGSGKTTILRLIKGTIPYLINQTVEGNVILQNQKKTEENFFSQSVEIGYLFQDFDLQFITSTVENELIFSLENMGQPREIIHQRLNWFLSKYPNFKSLLKRKPNTLSGGELAQVLFISTVIADSDILLLDEPLQNLDYAGKNQLLQIISTFKGKKTIIIASHDIEPFLQITDKFLIIDTINSSITQYHSKKEFLRNLHLYPWISISLIAKNYYLQEI